jgi:phosphatidate cytidylyltransferase
MTATWDSILILFIGAFTALVIMTAIGEGMRLRARHPGAGIEVFMTRLHSWWGMVVLFTGALLLGRTGVALLFAFASFAALREYYTFADKARADHMTLAAAFFVVLPLQYILVWAGQAGVAGVLIPVYAFLLLPAFTALRGDPQRFLVRISETQWGLMLGVYCVSHVPLLLALDIPGYAGRGVLLVAFLVIVVQAGDLVDFYAGRRIGRRRIVPGLSPRTWEGAATGVAAGALLGLLLAPMTPFGPLGAVGMAIAIGIIGKAGNLVLTAIKRDKGIRDWSHLIPGQGGVLDQLDSVIFAAPVFYHLTAYFWAA